MNHQFPFFPPENQGVRQQSGLRPNSLPEFIAFLSGARRTLLICVLLSLAAAALYIFASPRLFTAQSTLLVDSTKGQLSRPRDEASNFGVEIAEVETQLQILKSQKVALLVVDRLGLDGDPLFMGDTAPNLLSRLVRGLFSPAGTSGSGSSLDKRHEAALRLADAMSVARVGASYVVSVSVTAKDPSRAAQIANAVTEAYVTDRIEARLESAQRTNLEQERQRELRMRILSAATPPVSPSSPHRRIIVSVAAVFGVFLGLGIAFLRRAMDDRVRSPEQITSTGARLLGVIPQTALEPGRLALKKPSAFHYARLNPLSPFAQNLRKIKSAVQFAKTQSERGLCLGIVSAVPGEGKSIVAGNLADLLGASGRPTLLLDFDLGILDHKNVQCHGATPNYTFLGGAKLGKVLLPDEQERKQSFGVPEDLLASGNMDQFLSDSRQKYEYVLLDFPSVELLPDSVAVTRHVDALIVVTESGRLPFDMFAMNLSRLADGSAKLLGVVLNKASARRIGTVRPFTLPARP
jgi:polysaccharide biosynthesis transport protein